MIVFCFFLRTENDINLVNPLSYLLIKRYSINIALICCFHKINLSNGITTEWLELKMPCAMITSKNKA